MGADHIAKSTAFSLQATLSARMQSMVGFQPALVSFFQTSWPYHGPTVTSFSARSSQPNFLVELSVLVPSLLPSPTHSQHSPVWVPTQYCYLNSSFKTY